MSCLINVGVIGSHSVFEGVCETHIILTASACGGGVRAAVPDTTLADSADSGDSADESGE